MLVIEVLKNGMVLVSNQDTKEWINLERWPEDLPTIAQKFNCFHSDTFKNELFEESDKLYFSDTKIGRARRQETENASEALLMRIKS